MDLLELDGVSDIEKQLNNKIKFKLNRLKERLGNEWYESIRRTNNKNMPCMRETLYSHTTMGL